jgi:hypothetical protein
MKPGDAVHTRSRTAAASKFFPIFYPLVCPTLDPCCKLCSQRANMTVVGPATATQNLQAQFRVQSGYRLAEGSRLFLHQAKEIWFICNRLITIIQLFHQLRMLLIKQQPLRVISIILQVTTRTYKGALNKAQRDRNLWLRVIRRI